VLVPEAGMKAPFSGSFSEAVQFLHNFRRKNPALVQKNGWSTNIADIENDVDLYNAQRMVAAKYFNFVEMEGNPPASTGGEFLKKKRVGHVVAGLETIVHWIGSNKRPVDRTLAEARASTCADCPCNKGGDWKAYFTKPAADKIRYLLGIKHDLDLTTPFDKKLTVCTACDCELTLKVWAPFDIIRDNTPSDVWPNLDTRCWMLSEQRADSGLLPLPAKAP